MGVRKWAVGRRKASPLPSTRQAFRLSQAGSGWETMHLPVVHCNGRPVMKRKKNEKGPCWGIFSILLQDSLEQAHKLYSTTSSLPAFFTTIPRLSFWTFLPPAVTFSPTRAFPSFHALPCLICMDRHFALRETGDYYANSSPPVPSKAGLDSLTGLRFLQDGDRDRGTHLPNIYMDIGWTPQATPACLFYHTTLPFQVVLPHCSHHPHKFHAGSPHTFSHCHTHTMNMHLLTFLIWFTFALHGLPCYSQDLTPFPVLLHDYHACPTTTWLYA